MKDLDFAPYGKRGLVVCLVMAVVFIWMKFQGAIDQAGFIDLMKWDLLGFFGSKAAEYMPTFGNGKK